jgi:hypothetical protein
MPTVKEEVNEEEEDIVEVTPYVFKQCKLHKGFNQPPRNVQCKCYKLEDLKKANLKDFEAQLNQAPLGVNYETISNPHKNLLEIQEVTNDFRVTNHTLIDHIQKTTGVTEACKLLLP